MVSNRFCNLREQKVLVGRKKTLPSEPTEDLKKSGYAVGIT